jgi:N-glycosylase/DNA lyase
LNAVTCDEQHTVLTVRDYDLTATLTSGQAFRWRWTQEGWEGVVGKHWVRLKGTDGRIMAQTAIPVAEWGCLTHYLQVGLPLEQVLVTFPDDEPMRRAVAACRGLRLLRQDPWECLASFLLSSAKQIVQIQQIVDMLCERFGERVPVPPEHGPAYAFPSAVRLADCREWELRFCKMGFRAPFLHATAKRLAQGGLDLTSLSKLTAEEARTRLLELPGVGRKIADCLLLFAYGFQTAFPIDVWVDKAMRQLYFPRRRVSKTKLHDFAQSHFGPHAGYAQQ